MKEKVSIILPTYNRAHTLQDAVNSVLNQSYPDFELLIIDDASTDHTEELVRSMQDERIVYYKLEKNSGASAARNCGLKHAHYDYIAFEDSDDIWHQDKLEKQMDVLVHADADTGFCYHKMRYDLEQQYIILPSDAIPLSKKSGFIFDQLLYDNLIGCPTILARRDCIMQTTFFDEEMKALEDYDLVLQMAKVKKAVFLNEILLEAGYSTTGVSGSMVNYLFASCQILLKYKSDYVRTGTLQHRLNDILTSAERLGVLHQIADLLEKIMLVKG